MDDNQIDKAAISFEAVDALIKKRIESWKYLRRVYEGSSHWMNVVFITKEDILSISDQKTLQKRAEEWFYLGISIGPLLKLPSGQGFVSALKDLWDEYEAEYGQKSVAEKSVDRLHRKIFRRKDGDKQEHLETPNVPSTLDYVQIIYTLCDILVLVYQKLLDPEIDSTKVSKDFYNQIVKVDGRFKQYIITVVSKELNVIALSVLKSQVASLETLYSSKA